MKNTATMKEYVCPKCQGENVSYLIESDGTGAGIIEEVCCLDCGFDGEEKLFLKEASENGG